MKYALIALIAMTSAAYADPEKAAPPPEAPANQAAQAPVNGNPDVTLSAAEIRALMAAAAAEAHATDSAALAQAAKIHAADADALAQGAAAKFNAVLQAKQPTPAPAPSVTPTPTPSPEPTKSSDVAPKFQSPMVYRGEQQPTQEFDNYLKPEAGRHCRTIVMSSDGSKQMSGCD